MNTPLQRRAGNNVGIQPGSVPWLEANGNRPIVSPSGEVVLLQGKEGFARSPTTRVGQPGDNFLAFNPSATDMDYETFFVKGTDELPLGSGTVSSGGGFDSLDMGDLAGIESLLVLEADEKIILRVTSGGAGVLLYPPNVDLKFKGSKRGGFSDGGIVTVHEEITTTRLEIGPPRGKAWTAAPATAEDVDEPELCAVNFDAANDADIDEGLIHDGVLYEETAASSLSAQTLDGIGQLAEAGVCLSYPDKYTFKLNPKVAVPSGVFLLATFFEHDLPRDFPSADE